MLLVEQCRLLNWRLQGLQGCHDELAAELTVLRLRERRVAAHVLDADTTDNPQRPHVNRQGRQGTEHRHRYPMSLNFFTDRCAATIAGASGRHQEDSINTTSLEITENIFGHLFGDGHHRTVADRGVEIGIDPADDAFGF